MKYILKIAKWIIILVHSVQPCVLQCTKLLPFLGKGLGFSGNGLSEQGRRMQLRHRGFNLHSLWLRAVSEGSHLWEHICPQTHHCHSIGKYMIFLVPTGRIRVQLWVENIFDCNLACETSLRKWPMANTNMCRQGSGQRLWYYGLGSQRPVCSVFVSRSFPAQACTLAEWDVILFARLFWPMDLCCSVSDDVPTGSCLVLLSKQTWCGGWMQS